MAEAEMDTDSSSESDPDRISLRIRVTPDSRQKQVYVLMLTPQWQFDAYGIATVTRDLIQNLRTIDPEDNFIKISCAVLQEEGNIPRERSAEELKVNLKGYKQPRGRRREPNLEWLEEDAGNYYKHVVADIKYDFIIGHIPYIANGCLNLRDDCVERGHCPKVIFIAHDVPRHGNGETNDEQLREWLLEANVVFSMTKSVEEKIRQIGVSDHKIYIPGHPIELFKFERGERRDLTSIREMMMMTKEKKDLKVKGLDFPLAVNSVVEACQKTRARISLTMCTERKDDRADWENGQTNRHVTFRCDAVQDTQDMIFQFGKTDLFLAPFQTPSPLFGAEALSALAAGVPILISRHCGLGSLLVEMDEKGSVVVETDRGTWADRITQKIVDPEAARSEAKKLRERFLLDTRIATSQMEFAKVISGQYPRYRLKFDPIYF